MIASVIPTMVFFGSCQLVGPGPNSLLLSEVIPESRIVSEEDGIIEYQGVKYLLGRKDLGRKKRLIDSLDLLDAEPGMEIDLRFSGQVVIRNRKEAGD